MAECAIKPKHEENSLKLAFHGVILKSKTYWVIKHTYLGKVKKARSWNLIKCKDKTFYIFTGV